MESSYFDIGYVLSLFTFIAIYWILRYMGFCHETRDCLGFSFRNCSLIGTFMLHTRMNLCDLGQVGELLLEVVSHAAWNHWAMFNYMQKGEGRRATKDVNKGVFLFVALSAAETWSLFGNERKTHLIKKWLSVEFSQWGEKKEKLHLDPTVYFQHIFIKWDTVGLDACGMVCELNRFKIRHFESICD